MVALGLLKGRLWAEEEGRGERRKRREERGEMREEREGQRDRGDEKLRDVGLKGLKKGKGETENVGREKEERGEKNIGRGKKEKG